MKNKYFFAQLIVFAFALLIIGNPVFSQSNMYKANKFSKPTTIKYISRIDGINGLFIQYSDSLLRGGQINNTESLLILKEKGVTRIIDVVKNHELKKSAKLQGIKYFVIPFEASGLNEKIVKKYIKATSGAGEVCFFTSVEGKHKAGILSAMYRMMYNGWSYEKAMREFIKLGGDPIADKVFMESVRKLKVMN